MCQEEDSVTAGAGGAVHLQNGGAVRNISCSMCQVMQKTCPAPLVGRMEMLISFCDLIANLLSVRPRCQASTTSMCSHSFNERKRPMRYPIAEPMGAPFSASVNRGSISASTVFWVLRWNPRCSKRRVYRAITATATHRLPRRCTRNRDMIVMTTTMMKDPRALISNFHCTKGTPAFVCAFQGTYTW
jgi:hypothetical protein